MAGGRGQNITTRTRQYILAVLKWYILPTKGDEIRFKQERTCSQNPFQRFKRSIDCGVKKQTLYWSFCRHGCISPKCGETTVYDGKVNTCLIGLSPDPGHVPTWIRSSHDGRK